MVEFLPFYFFYSLLFQLSSVDMYISTLVYCSISLQNQVDSLYLYAWFISNKDTKLFTHFLRFFHILFQIY